METSELHIVESGDNMNVVIKKEPIDSDESNTPECIKYETEGFEFQSYNNMNRSTELDVNSTTLHNIDVKQETATNVYYDDNIVIKEENNEPKEGDFSSGDCQINKYTMEFETEAISGDDNFDVKQEFSMEENAIFPHEEHDDLDGFGTNGQKQENEELIDDHMYDGNNILSDDNNTPSDDTNEVNNVDDRPIGKKRFQCPNCDKSYTSKGGLNEHLLILHNPYSYQCGVCKELFRNSKELEQHMIKHSKDEKKYFKCQYCDRLFRTKRSCKEHETIHTGKPHKCDICEKTYVTKQSLKRHEKIHIREKSNSTIENGNVENINDQSTRSQSENSLTEDCLLDANEVDIKEESTSVNEKSLSCCGIKFSSFTTLEAHERLHKKITKRNHSLKCQYCEMTFTEMHLLKDHERKHTGEKPYKCQFCDSYFRTSGNRYGHEKNRCHIGKPFKCTICGKGYTDHALLKAHGQLMHMKEKQ
ncbi:unnamed protein product [Owenia fusiformis]|uniref:Uncharacterized protein n=1 Tax=Owenia fusiformis TaxID=6347 RepID=A0A8J1XWN4_OWEFU|nr:unnamed protein product [Owenia fusiformis]